MAHVNTITKRAELELLSLYLRRTPWEKGRWRLQKHSRDLCGKVFPAGGNRHVRTRHGFRMRVDLADWLGRQVFATGEYEPMVTRIVQALLGKGDTMIDVGANIGYFSLLGSKLVGAEGKVFAFEPVKQVNRKLLFNVVINDARNVGIYRQAVCDKDGFITVNAGPDNHLGTSSIRELKFTSGASRVAAVQLDSEFECDTSINLIKIDVEGAETRAIKGMQQLLIRDRPDVIVEVTDEYLRELGSSEAELLDLLSRLGYRGYGIDYDGVVPLDAMKDDLPDQYNALFTKRRALPSSIMIKDQWHG